MFILIRRTDGSKRLESSWFIENSPTKAIDGSKDTVAGMLFVPKNNFNENVPQQSIEGPACIRKKRSLISPWID